jgi:hypothetical protein
MPRSSARITMMVGGETPAATAKTWAGPATLASTTTATNRMNEPQFEERNVGMAIPEV